MSVCNDGATLTMPVVPAGNTYNTGNGGFGGFGDNGAFWIIILFLFIFCGWGNNGWGGNGKNAGSGSVMEGYVLTSDFATIERKLDNVNSGLCDGFYAVAQQFSTLQNGMNQGFAGINTAMLQGFAAVDRAVCNLQAQIASCCCEIQRQVEGVRYDMAIQAGDTRNLIQSTGCNLQNTMNNNTRDIIDNQNQNARAILDRLTAQEMAAKDAQIAAQGQQIFGYQLAASQERQTNDIRSSILAELRNCPIGTYQVPNPNCCYGPWGGMNWNGFNGYNNSCGCGNGCGNCG